MLARRGPRRLQSFSRLYLSRWADQRPGRIVGHQCDFELIGMRVEDESESGTLDFVWYCSVKRHVR